VRLRDARSLVEQLEERGDAAAALATGAAHLRELLWRRRTGLDGSVFADELANADGWRLKTGEYLVTPGVHAIASPGHTAGHMSLLIEPGDNWKNGRGGNDSGTGNGKGSRRPVILCGDAADLSENLSEEIAPGYCWQDNEALALASIRKLKFIADTESAELWPNHDMEFFRGLPRFPEWRGVGQES